MLTSRQVLKSWYLVFFQLPWLPEQEVSSGGSWQHLLRWTGMSAEAAARDAELMRDRGAARGALNWYRAMMFSSPLALRTKITVPTLYLWSDGDTAIGPTGAALTPRFVAGPYTPAELDALPARHFDAYPAPGR